MNGIKIATLIIAVFSSLAFVGMAAFHFWHANVWHVPPLSMTPPPWHDNIILGRKVFADTSLPGYENFGIVVVTGALTGEGIAFPNNSTTVYCDKDREMCMTYSIEGRNQMGRLYEPDEWDITKWTEDELSRPDLSSRYSHGRAGERP